MKIKRLTARSYYCKINNIDIPRINPEWNINDIFSFAEAFASQGVDAEINKRVPTVKESDKMMIEIYSQPTSLNRIRGVISPYMLLAQYDAWFRGHITGVLIDKRGNHNDKECILKNLPK